MNGNWKVIGLALCIGVASCAADDGEETEASSASLRIGPLRNVQEGGACKIVSGPNAGKTGTYDTTTDPGHVWCCTQPGGGGDCTECTGSSACTAASVRRPRFDIVRDPTRTF